MNKHVIAVDFGTSFTTAALRRQDAVGLVDLDGSGANRIPSCVYLDADTGSFLVGRAARNSGLRSPDAFERTPKRLIDAGTTLLGDRLVGVDELVHAVYRHVFAECRGERNPDAIHITHPAVWTQAKRDTLRDAAQAALADVGWDAPIALLAEPVAAAVEVANFIPEGAAVAVYDLGGGTFDAAVVRRSDGGFKVAGDPGGQDRCGGEEFDDMLLQEVGERIPDPDARRRLLDPQLEEVSLLAARSQLRTAVTSAKEELSLVDRVVIDVPLQGGSVELTRATLEAVIAPKIEASVSLLLETIGSASRADGFRDDDLVGVVLTGGSSRIPLVEKLVGEQTRLRVFTQPDRKGVVASGAARFGSIGVRGTQPDSGTRPYGETQPAMSEFTCRLALRRKGRWKSRQTKLVLGDGDLVVREYHPDVKSLERWAETTRKQIDSQTVVTPVPQRAEIAGVPALQLWMLTSRQDGSVTKYLHRCALTAANGTPARAIEIVASDDLAELADRVKLVRADDRFEYAAFALPVPGGMPTREQLTVVTKGGLLGSPELRVFAESVEVGDGLDEQAWNQAALARYGRVTITESTTDTFLDGEPALYREVNLLAPRTPIGATWAYWWTGFAEDRAVAVAVESRSRVARKRIEQFRDAFTLVPPSPQGARSQT
jgi:hypothetical protein